MKTVIVVGGLLKNEQGEVLVVQRPHNKTYPHLWEFPGGKIEPGETPEQALARELFEEINLIIDPQDLTPYCFFSHPYPHLYVTLLFYRVHKWSGDIVLKEEQEAYQWIPLANLKDIAMPEGNYRLLEMGA